MVFKITSEQNDSGLLMHIDGDLNHEGLNEFTLACERVNEPLTIDLSGLGTSDKTIAKVLQQLAREGVKLQGLSPYLSLLLSDLNEAS